MLSAFVGLLLMSGSALVQLMQLTVGPLDLQGFPLSHDEVAGAPGCSWGEYLQCSDEDFQNDALEAKPTRRTSAGMHECKRRYDAAGSVKDKAKDFCNVTNVSMFSP